MRRALFGLATLGAAFAIDAIPATAQAYPVYPWCAYYSGRGGSSNCYFSTFSQCMQSVSGVGGTCSQNPFYGAYGYGGTDVAPRRARRYYRRY